MTKKNNSNLKCVFKEADFNSTDGMLTYVWGPSLWHFLHTMSFNYPIKPTVDEKKKYMNFIKSLKDILPCKYCRINLKKNLKDTNFSMKKMKNRKTFSKFMFDLHNHINTMLDKKNTTTYEQVRNIYENFRSRCTSNADTSNADTSNASNASLNKNNKSMRFKCKNTKNCKKMCKCIKTPKEKGCTNPINGVKSKCLIRIVPLKSKKKTFNMDPKCMATKVL